jgi:hypothetical protein
MQRAWIVIGSLATVVALGFGTFNVIEVLAHEEVTETATFEGSGITALDISVENGSVEVIGGEGDEIRLVAEISHGLRRTGHRAEVEGSTLVVRSTCPLVFNTWCDADYHLEVPADLSVTASVDHGRLTVRDVTGTVDADGDNGSVELARLTGRVSADTDNGNVTATGLRASTVSADSDNGNVSLTFAEPPDDVRATTSNGNVEVVLPEGDASYRVEVDTSHGGTDVAVRTDPDGDRTVVGRTSNGNVTVRYPTG